MAKKNLKIDFSLYLYLIISILHFLFALMQKETKKIKAAVIAPRTQPSQRTKEHSDTLNFLFVFVYIVLFENTAGAVSR